MSPVKAQILGSGTIYRQPERGNVTIKIEGLGIDQTRVLAEVQETARAIQSQLRVLAPTDSNGAPASHAAVVQWSTTSVTMRSVSEYDHVLRANKWKGYEYAISVMARFRDFEKLSEFVSAVSVQSKLVTVKEVEWVLTTATQGQLRADAIKGAYMDALAKATAFAEVMGKSSITPVEIQQGTNARGDNQPGQVYSTRMHAPAPGGKGDTALSYSPMDVSYTAHCTVVFHIE